MLRYWLAAFRRGGDRGVTEDTSLEPDPDLGEADIEPLWSPCGARLNPVSTEETEDWTPPNPVWEPARVHAESIVRLLQANGFSGPVPSGYIERCYPEFCMMLGLHQIPLRDVQRELAKVVQRSRRRTMAGGVARDRCTTYIIPNKAPTVVPLAEPRRTMPASARTQQQRDYA